MAVVIGAIAHQRITIDTEMALDINITGNPDAAYIEGLLEGFYTNWNDPILEVRGAATRLISNSPFMVFAKRGTEDAVTRKGIFSVFPAAPVITSLPQQTLIRGIENTISVEIANKPTFIEATGPWIGLKKETTGTGVDLIGTIPHVGDATFSSNTGTISVVARSAGGEDDIEIDYILQSGVFYGGNPTVNGDRIIIFEGANDGQDISKIRSFRMSSLTTYAIAVDEIYLYHYYRNDIYRSDKNTPNEQRASRTLVYDFNRRSSALAVDENYLYAFDTTTCYVIDKLTGSLVKSFTISGRLGTFTAAAIDGNDLIVLFTSKRISWYDKTTGNNQTAIAKKFVNAPLSSEGRSSIMVVGNLLCLTDTHTDTIVIIDKNTSNAETATVLETWNVPTEYRNITGLATW